MTPSDKNSADIISKIQKDLSSGLLYTHSRINDNTSKILESTSFLYALIELLNEKGILKIEELDDRKRQVAERLVKRFVDGGLGLMYQDPEYDKYTFDKEANVNCESRLDTCKAVCCKLPFALSRQDVEEGIIRWEFGRPYLIAHGEDGYCVHLDRNTYKCTVREHRTVPCRGFDCRNNLQWHIWEDYEKKILSPELEKKIDRDNRKIYSLQIK